MSESGPQQTSLLGLLDKLIEPADPPPVSMMPQTWGWLLLAIVLCILLLLASLHLYGRWRANAYRRFALRELEQAAGSPEEIASILRRTALAAYPRREVAGLTGADWLKFLRASCRTNLFEGSAGDALVTAPYRDVPLSSELQDDAAKWIRSHSLGSSR